MNRYEIVFLKLCYFYLELKSSGIRNSKVKKSSSSKSDSLNSLIKGNMLSEIKVNITTIIIQLNKGK